MELVCKNWDCYLYYCAEERDRREREREGVCGFGEAIFRAGCRRKGRKRYGERLAAEVSTRKEDDRSAWFLLQACLSWYRGGWLRSTEGNELYSTEGFDPQSFKQETVQAWEARAER